MIKLNKKLVAAAAGAAVIVAGVGVGYAYWTTSGSGSSSDTGASSNGTVTYSAGFEAETLAPGTQVDVTYSATSTSAPDLAVTDPAATVSSNVAACDQYLSLDAQPTQGTT